MSDEELEKLYAELQEHYGDTLANYEHHPIQFRHQVKLYNYYKKSKENENRNL